jgi:uncharacterized protein (DUF2141 family)
MRTTLCGSLLIAVVTLMLPVAAAAGEMRIAIDGLRSSFGTVMIGLYDSAAGFDKAIARVGRTALVVDPSRYAAVVLRAGDAANNTITIGRVEPGRYTVIVIQDLNDNARLDRNFLGLPTEPYGFSNNAKGMFSAPSFEAAAVTLDGTDKLIRIVLINP